MRMYRKASKQRNWPREPLTRIIVKRTKLHIKQQRRKQKRNVAIAKARAYDHLYAYMDTTEGQKKVLRMAKEREKNSKDIYQSKVIKEKRGSAGGGSKAIGEMEGVLPEADE